MNPILKGVDLYSFCTSQVLFHELDPLSASWFGWNTLFKALSGAKMGKKEEQFFGKVTGGLAYNRKKIPKNVLFLIGRKGGKSAATSRIALYRGLTFDHKLAPGEFARNLIVSPSFRSSGINLDFICGLLEAHPSLKKHMIRKKMTEQISELRLDNGCTISAVPVSRVTGRGPSIYSLLLDEAAFFKVEGSFSDTEIFHACLPGMARFGNESCYYILTSPGRKEGLVFETYQRYFGVANDEILVVNGTSKDFNPTITDEFLKKEQARDPEYYKREFEAKFVDSLSAAFAGDNVDSCTVRGRLRLPFNPEREYFAAIDTAGLAQSSVSGDEWVVGIAHLEDRENESTICVVDALIAFSSDKHSGNYASPGQAIDQTVELCREYHISDLTGDKYGSQWAADQLKAGGIDFHFCETVKSNLYLELITAINSGDIELLDEPVANQQLKSLERRKGRGTKDRIDHGVGRKDDRCNVYALLNSLAQEKKAFGNVSFSWL